MNWFTVLKFALPIIAIGACVWQINDRAYDRGHQTAKDYCTNTTVPKARAEEQKICKETTEILKESCDALQTRLNDSTSRYVGLLKKHNSCRSVPITARDGGNDGTAGSDVRPVQGRVVAGELLDTLYACDKQTNQLIEWQFWYAKFKKAHAETQSQ